MVPRFVVLIALVVALGGFVYGVDSGSVGLLQSLAYQANLPQASLQQP